MSRQGFSIIDHLNLVACEIQKWDWEWDSLAGRIDDLIDALRDEEPAGTVIQFSHILIGEFQKYSPTMDYLIDKLHDLIDALQAEEHAETVDIEVWGWINDL